MHINHTLGIHSPWALGGSLERVFTHGNHWTISAGAKYQILDNLSVAILSGITFLKHEDHGSHKTPVREIDKALKLKKEYYERKNDDV